jgi:DhnA family fructose-bisphosphate aldolase class Ia
MKTSDMTEKQKKVIKRLFRTGRTYHSLAIDAGIENLPDRFEDLSYDMAKQIIRAHNGLLGLK